MKNKFEIKIMEVEKDAIEVAKVCKCLCYEERYKVASRLFSKIGKMFSSLSFEYSDKKTEISKTFEKILNTFSVSELETIWEYSTNKQAFSLIRKEEVNINFN